MSSFIYN